MGAKKQKAKTDEHKKQDAIKDNTRDGKKLLPQNNKPHKQQVSQNPI